MLGVDLADLEADRPQAVRRRARMRSGRLAGIEERVHEPGKRRRAVEAVAPRVVAEDVEGAIAFADAPAELRQHRVDRLAAHAPDRPPDGAVAARAEASPAHEEAEGAPRPAERLTDAAGRALAKPVQRILRGGERPGLQPPSCPHEDGPGPRGDVRVAHLGERRRDLPEVPVDGVDLARREGRQVVELRVASGGYVREAAVDEDLAAVLAQRPEPPDRLVLLLPLESAGDGDDPVGTRRVADHLVAVRLQVVAYGLGIQPSAVAPRRLDVDLHWHRFTDIGPRSYHREMRSPPVATLDPEIGDTPVGGVVAMAGGTRETPRAVLQLAMAERALEDVRDAPLAKRPAPPCERKPDEPRR